MCNHTDVRLVNGNTTQEGQVEICLNGLWGAVCGNRWDVNDAIVVCRQLGYDGREYELPYLLFCRGKHSSLIPENDHMKNYVVGTCTFT